MDKILIWGTGNAYKWFREFLFELAERGSAEILALVNKESEQTLDGYTVIHAENVLSYNFDYIVICAHGEMIDSIQRDIEKIGIKKSKVKLCSNYIETAGIFSERYEAIVSKQCEVLQEILNATDEQVNSYDWMFKKISEYGVFPFRYTANLGVTWTQWGILQIIEEFTSYCNYISGLHVNEVIEIGVYKGRSSYFMCALLERNNPNLHYVCVDIFDNLDSFDRYKAILPALDKKVPSTSEDYKDKEYDVVFIDADHSYDASIKDYLNVGRNAKKLTVFHDIYGHEYDGENGGTVRTWREVRELTSNYQHKIFSKYPEEWMGIGAVIWK